MPLSDAQITYIDALLHSLGLIKTLEADLAHVCGAIGLVDLELRLGLLGALFGVASALGSSLYGESVSFRSRSSEDIRAVSPLHPVLINYCQRRLFSAGSKRVAWKSGRAYVTATHFAKRSRAGIEQVNGTQNRTLETTENFRKW